MTELPDDWYEESDGQRLVLNVNKVKAGIGIALTELKRLHAKHGEQATADVIRRLEQ